MVEYEIFDPGVNGPLHELTRAEAEEHFRHFMNEMPRRLEIIQDLTRVDGITLNFQMDSLDQIDYWFPHQIDGEFRDNGEVWPTSRSFSICNDVGMYMGEMLCRQSETMHWELCTWPKDNIYYQRPVVTGFQNSPSPFEVDFDYTLCGYACSLVRGHNKEPGLLPRMFKSQLAYI